jgi:hypothetical protein
MGASACTGRAAARLVACMPMTWSTCIKQGNQDSRFPELACRKGGEHHETLKFRACRALACLFFLLCTLGHDATDPWQRSWDLHQVVPLRDRANHLLRHPNQVSLERTNKRNNGDTEHAVRVAYRAAERKSKRRNLGLLRPISETKRSRSGQKRFSQKSWVAYPAQTFLMRFLTAWRTRTMPFFAPGTPPSTMMRCFSASTWVTTRLRMLVVSLPY